MLDPTLEKYSPIPLPEIAGSLRHPLCPQPRARYFEKHQTRSQVLVSLASHFRSCTRPVNKHRRTTVCVLLTGGWRNLAPVLRCSHMAGADFQDNDDVENSDVSLPKVCQAWIESMCLVNTWPLPVVVIYSLWNAFPSHRRGWSGRRIFVEAEADAEGRDVELGGGTSAA